MAERLDDSLSNVLQMPRNPPTDTPPVSTSDAGGGNYNDMDKLAGIDNRLHRLEGGNDVLKWSAGIVSGVLIGMAAIIVTLQVFMFQNQSALSAKVDALPGQISSDIQELNRTLSNSITAARAVQPLPVQPPIVIFPPGTSATSGQGLPER